jgi:hypothetical protein
MKKMVVAGVVALALVAGAQQQASAYCKCNFGVGFNLSYEGGGNSFLWGLIKSAPCPGQMPIDGNLLPPGGGGYHGQVMDGAIAPIPTTDMPKPMPKDKDKDKEPEKVSSPTPVKPAAYFQYQPQAPAPQTQANPNTEDEPEYYYPSYYYGR